MVLPSKRGTNCETKLPRSRHVSKAEILFYLGLPNSVSKSAFSNVCGPPYDQKIPSSPTSSQAQPNTTTAFGQSRPAKPQVSYFLIGRVRKFC